MLVNMNSPTVNDEHHAPMGGVRDSGWGRTGPRSLDDFSDVIWINSHSGLASVSVLTTKQSTLVLFNIKLATKEREELEYRPPAWAS